MTEPEQPPTDVGPGLPEDGQPGTGMDPREHSENEVDQDDAPHTSTSRDSDPAKATGNPQAAGGDGDIHSGKRGRIAGDFRGARR